MSRSPRMFPPASWSPWVRMFFDYSVLWLMVTIFIVPLASPNFTTTPPGSGLFFLCIIMWITTLVLLLLINGVADFPRAYEHWWPTLWLVALQATFVFFVASR